MTEPIVVWPPGAGFYGDCNIYGSYHDCSYGHPAYELWGAITVCCPN